MSISLSKVPAPAVDSGSGTFKEVYVEAKKLDIDGEALRVDGLPSKKVQLSLQTAMSTLNTTLKTRSHGYMFRTRTKDTPEGFSLIIFKTSVP